MELKMERPISKMLLQKDCSCKFQFCTKVYASPKLVSPVQEMTGQHKDKLPDASHSSQNVETTRNVKLTLTGLKDTFITVN